MASTESTTHRLSIRRFQECDGTWSLDAVDASGRHTEACWNFDTEDGAIAAGDEFIASLGL